jgi:hypothetical protein
MYKKIIILSTVLSFVLGGLLVYLYRNFESRIFDSNVSNTSSAVFNSSVIQSKTLEISESSLSDVPVYPFLITAQGVFDQTMKKVISFDKEQNSKSQFQFMGRDLMSLDSLRNYSLTRLGNDYYTHDGKNLIIVSNGDFEKSSKVDLKKEILYLEAVGDKLFVIGYDQKKCPIKEGGVDQNTCKFDLYYYDYENSKELKYLNSHFGLSVKNNRYNVPEYVDQDSFWLTSGYGDACMSNSVFGKFNYEGDYLSGYSVDSNCGDVKLSRLTYSEYKAKDSYYGTFRQPSETLYSAKCKFGPETDGNTDPNCEKIKIDLQNLELQYIPKELVIYDRNPPEKYYTCEIFKVNNFDGYNAKYYYKNVEIRQDQNTPYGEMLGCEDWNFFMNDETHKNDPGYIYQENTLVSKNFLIDCNVSGKLNVGACYFKTKDNQEFAKIRILGYPKIGEDNSNFTEFVTNFNGYGVCANHKYRINNQSNEITEIKPYGDCPAR